MSELLKLQAQLEAKFTEQQSYSRCTNIRLYRVPELAENISLSTIAFVEQFLQDKFNLPDTIVLQIREAHRSLEPQRMADAQPRSIVIKFLSLRTKKKRSSVWLGRRKVSPGRGNESTWTTISPAHSPKMTQIYRGAQSFEGTWHTVSRTTSSPAEVATRGGNQDLSDGGRGYAIYGETNETVRALGTLVLQLR